MVHFLLGLVLVCGGGAGVFVPTAGWGQSPELRSGDPVPREMREMYERGLAYLVSRQAEDGSWPGNQQGAGVTGMAVLCLLASGEDPNFGPYAVPVQRGIRNIIQKQEASTGYFGGSMYHHGFALLALAEAYGVVDERRLQTARGNQSAGRSIGESLELGVRMALTSQNGNSLGAWRYSPSSNDADTSVAGAVLVGLLAARNAGIEIPDEGIDRAIAYFVSMTAANGQVAYSGGLGGFDESMARISIGCLVYAIARRKDLPQFQQTKQYLTERLTGGNPGHGSREYQQYYQAQALFQSDYEAWKKWNQDLTRQLRQGQQPDGSFTGNYGTEVSTCLSLLSLAVNYRFLPIYER